MTEVPVDQITLARVNLNAILRTLEKLPELDETTAALVEGGQETIQFTAPRAATVRLAIGGGKITHHRGRGPNTIHLTFPAPSMVNAMFDGTGNPVPVKGFRKLDYLKGPFTDITDRLSYFLKPTDELLADDAYRDANAILTLYVAVYALAEIANSDPKGKLSAERMADGDIVIGIEGGESLTLVARGGKLSVTTEAPTNKRASMIFATLEAAGAVLRGEMASYTAIGRDLLKLSGYVPLLDNMNKILGLVPVYLGEE